MPDAEGPNRDNLDGLVLVLPDPSYLELRKNVDTPERIVRVYERATEQSKGDPSTCSGVYLDEHRTVVVTATSREALAVLESRMTVGTEADEAISSGRELDGRKAVSIRFVLVNYSHSELEKIFSVIMGIELSQPLSWATIDARSNTVKVRTPNVTVEVRRELFDRFGDAVSIAYGPEVYANSDR